MQRLARDNNVMRYVLIWLENDEQIAGFVQHAIDEAAQADRRDYCSRSGSRGPGISPVLRC